LIVFAADAAGSTKADATPAAVESPEEPATGQTPASPAGATNGAADRPTSGKIVTSPAIRRRAREAGIDLNEVPGSGAGGRILRSDFDAFLGGRRAAPAGPTAAVSVSPGSEQKVIGLRRIIAERMTASKREIPHFSYVEEVDMTALEALRKHLNDRRDTNRLTLLPFIAMALARALREFPQCNASFDKERNVVVRHGSVHLGIATQTPDGLKVPVVRFAESRSIDDMADEIRRVSEAARNNTARKDELAGSTITLTSLGKLGGIVTTPVINMPEVAIIGVNRAVERPVVVDGQIAVRLMMNLSSSFDHRFVDGYDAAAMIQQMKDRLEHPATIFMP